MKRILFAAAIVAWFGIVAWSIRSRRQPAVRWVTVTVAPGDTLWQLCDRANDDSVDLYQCVSLTRSRCPGTIQPGQRVKVPIFEEE